MGLEYAPDLVFRMSSPPSAWSGTGGELASYIKNKLTAKDSV